MTAVPQSEVAHRFAEMARKSATRGSKNFIWLQPHDERIYFPSWRGKQSDNPLLNWRGTWKWRWILMDFRIFGFKEAIRKNYYMSVAWHHRGERIYMGSDENGNKYWQSWDAQRSGGGRWVEPADPHWFRGWDSQTPPPACVTRSPGTSGATTCGTWSTSRRASSHTAPSRRQS